MDTKNPSETLPPATPNGRADDRHPLTRTLMWDLIQGRVWMARDLALTLCDWLLLMILVVAVLALIVLSSYVLIMLFKG